MKTRTAILITTMLALGAACAGREKALARTATALDAARYAFVEGDLQRQREIADGAPTLADGQERLRAYRAARAKVSAAFIAAYTALAAASLELTEVSFREAVAAAGTAVRGLRELGVAP